jgi:hypothetical protein
MRHARTSLTDVRPRTRRESALKARHGAAEDNLVALYARTTDAIAGAAA